MNLNTLKRVLSVVLLVLLGLLAAYGGARLGKFYGEPLDTNASTSAETVITVRDEAPKSKYNVLLMGTDAEGGLTDVMMIYQIDPKHEKVNVLSIPRDTRILFQGHTEKINAAHSYGRMKKLADGTDRGDEYAIRAVKALTGIPIHHYICISTSAFREIIDALDGFDFDVPQNMDYDDPWQDLHIHLKKGFQHLDGDKAEQLIRFRKYPNGDIDRVKVQQDALKALIQQKVNPVYLARVGDIFKMIMDEQVNTDMTTSEAIGMAQNILSANSTEDGIQTYTIDGSFWEDKNKTSYWAPNMTLVKKMVAEVFGYDENGRPIPEADDTETDVTGEPSDQSSSVQNGAATVPAANTGGSTGTQTPAATNNSTGTSGGTATGTDTGTGEHRRIPAFGS